MPRLRCNGVEIHYLDSGQGEPLVFLSGLAGDHLSWMAQVRAFAGGFRCLALDNRDSGRSGASPGPYTVADLAEDVAALLGRLSLPPAHLVGLSLGGMIGQELALRHPRRVRSLFLIGTLARADAWFTATLDAYGLMRRQAPDSPAFLAALLPWLVGHEFFHSAKKVEWLRGLLRQAPHPQGIDGFFRQCDAIRGHDVLDRLAAIHCPVRVVAGEDDRLVPPRYAREMVERLPGARLDLVPGVGHALPVENPALLNRLLADFLREVCGNLSGRPLLPRQAGGSLNA